MFGLGAKKLKLLAPVSGTQTALADVPDAAFSAKILGDGAAIEPGAGENIVKAPCDGEIMVLFPTGHAVGLKTPEGVELLIHIGIDTVELKDGVFEKLAAQGDSVKQGQPLIRFDADRIKAAGKAAVTPFVVTSPGKVQSIKVFPGPYKTGETPVMELRLE